MTTKKDHKQITLKTSKNLELSTAEFFGSLFTGFIVGLGRTTLPSDVMIETYWNKLKEFPELIIMRMLEDYARDSDPRCPTVGEMVKYCWSSYNSHMARTTARQPEPVEENLSEDEKEYRIAVRRAVFAVLRTNGLEVEEQHRLITGAVHRVAKEHNKLPIKGYLAWKD